MPRHLSLAGLAAVLLFLGAYSASTPSAGQHDILPLSPAHNTGNPLGHPPTQ